MTALRIAINGHTIATISTTGFDLIEVRIGGTRIDQNFADLNVSGGSYPTDGESCYLTWVNQLPLEPRQLVSISLVEFGASSLKGKTIEELFPDEDSSEPMDFEPTPEFFNELRSQPKVRQGFAFSYTSSSGLSYEGKTTPEEHAFGFSVLWESRKPEQARVSLHSYTLDGLQARAPMNDRVTEILKIGSDLSFQLLQPQ